MIKKAYVRKLKMKDGVILPFLFVQNKGDLIIFLALGERLKQREISPYVSDTLYEVDRDDFDVNAEIGKLFDLDDYWYFKQDLQWEIGNHCAHYFALLKSKNGKPDLIKYKYEPMYRWVRDWGNDEDETDENESETYDPDEGLRGTYQWDAFKELLSKENTLKLGRYMAQKAKEWRNDQK